ncbi:hypothetical protein BDU57DRAFT_528173 [Ampelomyces quisqualis]|uniref:Uncharacterized protein n=1 Tax=Ampelomyces quisqualis TaxID=50730 RepID=A0A6A5QRT4_AMPQU|nr:hypothetical protein BDU57DRAFT_528173 [Ampelomyces quisqualis]
MRTLETLHLYNHTLIQQCTILRMEEPDPVDIRNMQAFYDGASMNHGDTLIGPNCDIWGTILEKDSHSKELVVLRAREGKTRSLESSHFFRSRCTSSLHAKRTDIFAVTAAFAAIHVVLVGQELDQGPIEVVVKNTDLMKAICAR